MPAPPLLLALALIVLFLGGFSLVFGFQHASWRAALFGFTIAASLAMHNFWDIRNPIERAADYEIFARNIAIAGALLVLVGIGPGPIAIETVAPKRSGSYQPPPPPPPPPPPEKPPPPLPELEPGAVEADAAAPPMAEPMDEAKPAMPRFEKELPEYQSGV